MDPQVKNNLYKPDSKNLFCDKNRWLRYNEATKHII